jgi:hypothetical protein
MRAEAHAPSHAVFVNHSQTAKSHVLRIAIIGERKSVTSVQPAVVEVAALLGRTNFNHNFVPRFTNNIFSGSFGRLKRHTRIIHNRQLAPGIDSRKKKKTIRNSVFGITIKLGAFERS